MMAQITRIAIAMILLTGIMFSGQVTEGKPTWENITLQFFVDAANRPSPGGSSTAGLYGLFVNARTGDVVVNYSPWNEKVAVKPVGLYVSRDQGNTWTMMAENPVSGRGQTGFWCNGPGPFDGRMVLWTIDGVSASTSDAGVTWTKIGRQGRGFDFGDLDWTSPKPQTLFALEHEPWFRVLSTDGGQTWKRLDEAADKESFARNKNWYPRLGVLDASTLVATDGLSDGILFSRDLGATWTKVSDFRPLGAHPIHFENKLYWAASAGVIVSEDGKDWKLLGCPLPNATWGPFFGANNQEILVVTDRGVQLSRDGAATWTQVASAPPGVWLGDPRTLGISFAWDYSNRLLYAAHAGSGCFRLRLP